MCCRTWLIIVIIGLVAALLLIAPVTAHAWSVLPFTEDEQEEFAGDEYWVLGPYWGPMPWWSGIPAEDVYWYTNFDSSPTTRQDDPLTFADGNMVVTLIWVGEDYDPEDPDEFGPIQRVLAQHTTIEEVLHPCDEEYEMPCGEDWPVSEYDTRLYAWDLLNPEQLTMDTTYIHSHHYHTSLKNAIAGLLFCVVLSPDNAQQVGRISLATTQEAEDAQVHVGFLQITTTAEKDEEHSWTINDFANTDSGGFEGWMTVGDGTRLVLDPADHKGVQDNGFIWPTNSQPVIDPVPHTDDPLKMCLCPSCVYRRQQEGPVRYWYGNSSDWCYAQPPPTIPAGTSFYVNPSNHIIWEWEWEPADWFGPGSSFIWETQDQSQGGQPWGGYQRVCAPLYQAEFSSVPDPSGFRARGHNIWADSAWTTWNNVDVTP